jgi:hypothetical protein
MNFFANLAKEFELEPGEEVLVEARKHWVLFALGLIPFAVLAVLPLMIPAFLHLLTNASNGTNIVTSPLAPYASLLSLTSPAGRLAYGIWLLAVWTAAWGAFTRYYLNVWILTNVRIVEVTQRSFFNRQVSSTLLHRVQDVTTEVQGILFSILGIGNIHVQSAGTVDEFHMDGVANPEMLRDMILARVAPDSKNAGV